MRIKRIISSLLVGAMTGALLFAGWYLFIQLLTNGPEHMLKYRLGSVAQVFIMTFVGWLVGLLLIGLPAWFFMHRAGKTSWAHAAATGFGLAFFISFALSTRGFMLWPHTGSRYSAGDSGGPTWIDNSLTLHGWVNAAQSSLVFAIVAVAVTLSLWAMAYRR